MAHFSALVIEQKSVRKFDGRDLGQELRNIPLFCILGLVDFVQMWNRYQCAPKKLAWRRLRRPNRTRHMPLHDDSQLRQAFCLTPVNSGPNHFRTASWTRCPG
ncbi:hypothetical protein Agabi119p4_10991 [Agaricus bisporus var. burnettii]|uniref:Uncharacterized protein n=1 Tax=Agaricus bisporus var. burnettii TaxID=192524 RepID=A0A8H7EW93_AGABI|nr:hypothetical protein Agabi119p4_10991 [Agaricus bisporus var. burnettii]